MLSISKIIQIFNLHERDHCDAFSRNEKSRLTFPFFFPLDPVDFFFFYHFHFLIFLKSLKLLVKIMAIAGRQVKVSAFSQPLTLWFEKFLASSPHWRKHSVLCSRGFLLQEKIYIENLKFYFCSKSFLPLSI